MNIPRILAFLYPGAQWSCGETFDSLVWLDKNIPKPTWGDMELGHIRLWKADRLAEHKLPRAKAYPSLADQLDMLWHAMHQGEMPKCTAFYDAIAAVKDAHPKKED